MGTQINNSKNIKKKTLPYAGKSLRDQSKLPEGGSIEKSGTLFNQQETVEKEERVPTTGSSETYTQSSSKVLEQKAIEPALDSARPSHKGPYTIEFIDWLIGFIEGDGSFGRNLQTGRVQLIVSQKNPKVLYFIKKSLGYGRIFQGGDGYFRYTVADKEHMGYIIKIVNGRLRLEKTRVRFEAWVKDYVKTYRLHPIKIEIGDRVIDSSNA